MVRKTTGFTAVIAAIAFTVFAGAEGSGANAQVAAQAAQNTSPDAQLTEEVVPVFVEKEVVQELPETPEADTEIPATETQASSLRELVATMPAAGSLSEEMQCLAGAVYFESRGEPLAGQLAERAAQSEHIGQGLQRVPQGALHVDHGHARVACPGRDLGVPASELPGALHAGGADC